METYQLETFEAYKIYGTTHNVKTNLCNKTWLRLNDKNRHEVLIFNENGTLIISCNGLATNNTWKYIQFDNYLVINSPQQTYLLHPFFFNNGIVVALQLDGTKNYSFLIAEHNTQQFAPQNMTQLLDYFKELDKNFQQKKEKIATLSSDYKRKEEVANEAWSIVEERWRRKPIYENIHFIYAPNSAAAVLNFLLGLAIGVFLSYKFLQVSKWY